MSEWPGREGVRREIGFNKKVLKRLADEASAIKNRLRREYDEAKRKLEAQEAVEKRVREEYMNYMYQARRWEMANAPPPMGGTLHERTWDVTYQAEPKLSRPVTIYSPWLTGAQGGLVERNRTVAPDALSSESEDEPLNERRERMAPNAAMDGGEEGEDPEVAVMGERTWEERDAALRQKAIALESCVDQVFHKLGLEVYKQ